MLTLYTYFHRFKEFVGKACLRKVIDLIHKGEIAFLLLYMEWYNGTRN